LRNASSGCIAHKSAQTSQTLQECDESSKAQDMLVAHKVRGMCHTSVLHRKQHMQLIAGQQRDNAVSKIPGGSETEDADRSHFHEPLPFMSSAPQQICHCPKLDH